MKNETKTIKQNIVPNKKLNTQMKEKTKNKLSTIWLSWVNVEHHQKIEMLSNHKYFKF